MSREQVIAEVERFDPFVDHDPAAVPTQCARMQPMAHGQFVRYSDYRQLQARNAEQAAELARLRAEVAILENNLLAAAAADFVRDEASELLAIAEAVERAPVWFVEYRSNDTMELSKEDSGGQRVRLLAIGEDE